MPLPPNGQTWPPTHLADIRTKMAEWDAWLVGDPTLLEAAYGSTRGGTVTRPSQYAGGVVGAVSRFFWGRPATDLTQRRDHSHVPLPADLAQASADLLYAEPPTITLPEGTGQEVTQGRVEEYLTDGLTTVLSGGAENGAALGGRFQRVTWDPAMLDRPFLTTVDADAAVPEFRWDRLVAVTFTHVLDVNGQTYLRHLERHELDPNGHGIVLHGLYEGTADNLGRAVPLTEHGATAGIVVDPEGVLVGPRTPGLLVEYIPNLTPQRAWRRHPVGKSLGRSDFDGIEPLFDDLDEAYSSWMRDIRLAKARLLVPEYMLRSNGPGKGSTFDMDQEVFTPLNVPLSETDTSGQITPQQFAMRTTEHIANLQEITTTILRSAGYSAQTFGEDETGGAATATEIRFRERRSGLTRKRKSRLEKPAVARLVHKMLLTDQAVFGTKGLVPALPAVDFGDGLQETPLELAQTAQALKQAQAASTEVLVRTVHPDWDDPRVDDEVAAIVREQGLAPVADPADPGMFG